MAQNPQLQKALVAFETRPPAEKFLVVGTLIALMVWGYLSFVSDPIKADMVQLEQSISTSETRFAALQLRAQQADENSREDPNRAARERLERLVAEETEIRTALEGMTGTLVTPISMNRLLTAVLEVVPGLFLTNVVNLTPVQIGTASGAGSSGAPIYRHGLKLNFEGSYLATLNYLMYLESISEGFYWDSIQITPMQWPKMQITLNIHTISQDAGFFGV